MANTRLLSSSKSKRIIYGAVGDSVTAAGYQGSGFFDRLDRTSLGVQRYVGGNFAASGKRSDEILATQIPQAIAVSATAVSGGLTHCLTQFGTNDISQGIAESVVRANAIAIWAALRAAGIEPIDIGLQPVASATNAAKAAGHNAWRRNYCKQHGIQHIDIWTSLASSAGLGAYASGLGFDTIHPNSVAHRIIAGLIQAACEKPYAVPRFLAAVDDRTFASMPNTTNLISNGVSFSDTNADGLPDAFNPAGSGGTYSVQAVDSGGFGKWARCAMTAGSAVGIGGTAQTLAAMGWSVGDKLRAAYRIRWTDVSQALQVSTKFTGITPASGWDTNMLYNDVAGTASGDDMYIEHDCVIGGGTVVGYQWSATGTGYFEINRPIVMNLTQLGLS